MQYLYTLSNGGFLGEYNIMFGLFSNLNYQADIDTSEGKQIIIFSINKRVFIESICQDFVSFTHFHDLAL